MSTVLETALEAARQAIAVAVAPVNVELDEPEPEDLGAAGYIGIALGEPIDVEVTFGQGIDFRHYSFIHAAEITIYVATVNGRRDRLAVLREATARAIEAEPTLGGLVDLAEVGQPSATHYLAPADGTPIGILSMPLRLEYQSTSSAG